MQNKQPRHVAIIMDGNGRWAAGQGLGRVSGHQEGARVVNDIVTSCRERGVEFLTLYAFSAQNWLRPEAEVGALMQLLHDYVQQEWTQIMGNNIRLVTIGETERLPELCRLPLKALVEASADNTGMVLALALSYGGREELTRAARLVAKRVAAGALNPDDITEADIAEGLFTAGWPDPDLLIRTSGEERLSNFLLWQLAYSELYFTQTPWPEFSVSELDRAFAHYAQRQRRFGKTSAQIQAEIGCEL